jgi:hypothetical protein
MRQRFAHLIEFCFRDVAANLFLVLDDCYPRFDDWRSQFPVQCSRGLPSEAIVLMVSGV